MDDEDGNWDFEGMVIAEEVALSGLQARLREMQRVREDGNETVPTTIIKVVELAREDIEAKRKNAKLSNRDTDENAKLGEARAVKGTTRE